MELPYAVGIYKGRVGIISPFGVRRRGGTFVEDLTLDEAHALVLSMVPDAIGIEAVRKRLLRDWLVEFEF